MPANKKRLDEDQEEDRPERPIYKPPQYSDARSELENTYIAAKDSHLNPKDRFAAGISFTSMAVTFLKKKADQEVLSDLKGKISTVIVPRINMIPFSDSQGQHGIEYSIERGDRVTNKVPQELALQCIDRDRDELYRNALIELTPFVQELLGLLVLHGILEWERQSPGLAEEADDADE